MNSADVTNAALRFCFGGDATNWYITDISLVDIGQGTGVAPSVAAADRSASWSISKTGGALRIRGPVESAANLSLYDTRGKVVRSIAAKDGVTLNAVGIPAGSYIAVVRNRAGTEVYKTRVSLMR